MPDLTLVPMRQCSESLIGKSADYGRYKTAIFGPHQFCNCKGFKYRRTCKHVKDLESKICTYHEQIDGPPNEDKSCPKCGGKTVVVMVGV